MLHKLLELLVSELVDEGGGGGLYSSCRLLRQRVEDRQVGGDVPGAGVDVHATSKGIAEAVVQDYRAACVLTSIDE